MVGQGNRPELTRMFWLKPWSTAVRAFFCVSAMPSVEATHPRARWPLKCPKMSWSIYVERLWPWIGKDVLHFWAYLQTHTHTDIYIYVYTYTYMVNDVNLFLENIRRWLQNGSGCWFNQFKWSYKANHNRHRNKESDDNPLWCGGTLFSGKSDD